MPAAISLPGRLVMAWVNVMIVPFLMFLNSDKSVFRQFARGGRVGTPIAVLLGKINRFPIECLHVARFQFARVLKSNYQ
jgi:hypothetical protein